MKNQRYYKILDFTQPVGTHRYVDNIKSRRKLASYFMTGGRTFIQPIYEDGYVMLT